MDYRDSYESRAYFNLYYETIKLAISERYTHIDFGPTTYDFKMSLGSNLQTCNLLMDCYSLRSRLIKTILQKSLKKLSHA
jgi:CelD/BcsL family acetyltransferase involved in cellulose biosynthesis